MDVLGSGLAALAIGAVLVVLHTRPQRSVRATDQVEEIHLNDALFVPTLLMLLPWQSFTVVAAASIAGSLAARRELVKTAFNLGQLLLATAAGITVVALLGARPSASPNVREALTGMLGALTLTVVSAVAVRGMVSLATGDPPLLREIAKRLVPAAGAVTLGGVSVIAIGAHPWSAVLVLGVVVFVHRAYAASVNELIARRQAERLQHAIGSLRTHTDPERVRVDLIAAARDLLGAGAAAIVEADDPDPPRSLSAPLQAGERLRVDQRRGIDHWDERDRDTLVTLAGVAGDVLRSAELIARLRTITNSQSEGVIALDLDARITFVNPAAIQMLGAGQDTELLGKQIRDKLTLRHRRRTIDFASMVTRQFVAQDSDGTLGPPDGDTLDIAYSITPLRADDAHVGAVLVLRDVTERRAFQDELTRRALHDELTGLPNRRLLLERLDHAIVRSASSGVQHGLLFLDLDRFKLVNDSYGHLVGDKLLIEVAHRLLGALTPADTVARMSGEEFVVLVEDADGIDQVALVAERLLDRLSEPFEIVGHHVSMSASIGVGLTSSDQSADDVLAAVDAAMYAAKAAGRNCYFLTTDASVDEARARLDLEVKLRQGLKENELELHYQPIVATREGDVIGVEALVRWHSPQRGMLAPLQFVPLAEETGLIVPMGRWVLEEACRTVAGWTQSHPERRPLTVSVNLSALQFAQHRLVEDVATTLEETGLPASQLCLEITETVLMGDTAATQATLGALHDLGVRVAIDDFGTGYSSLSYLKRFSIDVVKLDQTFIEGLVTDPVDIEIATAVLRLSDALKMQTVAEGVETEAQRLMLVELGCPYMQGFLTAKPLPADDFVTFWDGHHTDAAPAALGLRQLSLLPVDR
ncbi:MAG: EAL domain-containing protein [Nocardioidaceae bacterium]|nr:EAL domain-containing protein [Nocardioidaceae bacterium]